ncbi:MAG: hypothetical protein ACKVS9_16915, partial [Phycisphaerae bacterium]
MNRTQLHARRLGIATIVALLGCDQKPASPSSQPMVKEPPIAPPAVLPQYRFASDAGHLQHPEAAAFVTQFLETCLAGDYVAYRRLVSRYENPESKERFQAIYYGLRSITVIKLEPLPPIAELPEGTFRVISEAEFDPAAKVSLRHRSRKIAILAFLEEGQWRMRPAPAAL